MDPGLVEGANGFRFRTLTRIESLPEGVLPRRIDSGARSFVVLGTDGRVYTSESEVAGELGVIPGLPDGVSAVRVSAADEHTLVVGDDGVAYGIGDNEVGELTGSGAHRSELRPLAGLPKGVRATDVVAQTNDHEGFSIVLGSDGVAYGTGFNLDGQLTGQRDGRRRLTPLGGLPNGVRARGIAASTVSSLVIGSDGRAYGAGYWGGSWAHGDPGFRRLRVLTGLPRGVTRASGWFVLAGNGVVYRPRWSAPGAMQPFTGWRVAATGMPTIQGTSRVGATLTATSGRWLPRPTAVRFQWLANGRPIPRATSPRYTIRPQDLFRHLTVRVTAGRPGMTDGTGLASTVLVTPAPPVYASALAVSGRTMVLDQQGRVYRTGPLVGQETARTTPTGLSRVHGITQTITSIDVGAHHQLFLTEEGDVYGVESNVSGQLTGNAEVVSRPRVLHGLPVGVTAKMIAAGANHSVVAASDGQVYATALPLNGWANQLTPVPGLPQDVAPIAVSAGSGFVLVLGDDGVVYGAGSNQRGQLTGTDSGIAELAPLLGLPPGVRGVAVDAGSRHTLVLADDGVVYGTGDNSSGQLTGTGRRTSLTPLAGLPTGITPTRVYAGSASSIVIGDNGVTYGAGSNPNGQLTGIVGPRRPLLPLTGLPSGVRALAAAASDSTWILGDGGVAYTTGVHPQDARVEPAVARLPHLRLQPYFFILRSLGRPVIEGTGAIGSSLTARAQKWLPDTTRITYQWNRNGVPIANATGATYRVTKRDRTAALTVTVIGHRAGFQPVGTTSVSLRTRG